MVSTRPLVGMTPAVRTRFGFEVVHSTGDSISILWRDNLRFMAYADRAGVLRDF
jgi:hypothetical protein